MVPGRAPSRRRVRPSAISTSGAIPIRSISDTRIIFHRHRDFELDLGPGREGVLLASLFQPPAGLEFRQSRGHGRGAADHALLARHGSRWLSARCDSLPGRARRHQQRESARDARRSSSSCAPRSTPITEPVPARGGQSVAGGRARVFRRRRRMPHGVSLSADAAHLHVDRAGRPLSDHRDHAADARTFPTAASGRFFCAITTS